MRKIDFSKFYLSQQNELESKKSENTNALITASLIDLSQDYPDIDFLLEYKGVGCFPRGDLQAIKAKAKQGKSFSITCLITAILKGGFIGLSATKENLRVLLIDTEQHPRNVVKSARRVHTLCGWDTTQNNDRLQVLALRALNVEERKQLVEDAINTYRPDVVFLDGIRDIMNDFNSISESGEIINLVLRLSKEYDAAICAVLHENKADGNMRGHIGTELINKCSDAYQVKKDASGTITVEQTESRNAPIDDWAFFIDDKGLPAGVIVKAKLSSGEAKNNRIKENIGFIFSKKGEYKHSDLLAEYMEIACVKERAAAGHIADALKQGIIKKKENGLYVLDFV